MAQIRINKVLRELNISLDRAVDFLETKGIEIEKSPNTKISQDVYDTLADEFQTDATKREKAQEVSEAKLKEKEALREKRERELEEKAREEEAKETILKAKAELSGPKQVGKIDLDGNKPKAKTEAPKKEAPKAEIPKEEAPSKPEVKKEKEVKKEEPVQVKEEPKASKPKKEDAKEQSESTSEPVDEKIKTQYKKLSGPNITGKKIDLSQFNKPKKKKEDKSKATDNTNKEKVAIKKLAKK